MTVSLGGRNEGRSVVVRVSDFFVVVVAVVAGLGVTCCRSNVDPRWIPPAAIPDEDPSSATGTQAQGSSGSIWSYPNLDIYIPC